MARVRGTKTGIYRDGHLSSGSYIISKKGFVGGSILLLLLYNFLVNLTLRLKFFNKSFFFQDLKVNMIKNLLVFKLEFYWGYLIRFKSILFFKWRRAYQSKAVRYKKVNRVIVLNTFYKKLWKKILNVIDKIFIVNKFIVLNKSSLLFKEFSLKMMVFNTLYNKMKFLNFYRYCSFIRQFFFKFKMKLYLMIKKLFPTNHVYLLLKPVDDYSMKVSTLGLYAARRFKEGYSTAVILSFLYRQYYWLSVADAPWKIKLKDMVSLRRCLGLWVLFKGRLTKRLRKNSKLRKRGLFRLSLLQSNHSTVGLSVRTKYGVCGIRLWVLFSSRVGFNIYI